MQLQGLPSLNLIHGKSFVKCLNFKNLLEEGSLAPTAHKVNRFSAQLLRPWSQPYGFRETSLLLPEHRFTNFIMDKK